MNTWVHRNDREIVDVSGPDARSFLQSLVSQDLDPLVVGDGVYSLLLQPQGKLVAPFRLLVLADDHFQLDADRGAGALLLEGLARFKIRVKVELAAHAGLATLRVRGAETDALLSAAALPVPSDRRHAHVVTDDGIRVVRALWGAIPGVDVFVPIERVGSLHQRLVDAGAIVFDEADYDAARIEHGVLVFGRDIDDSTIAQEAELETEAVSFTKGCFVGQELVCRIDTRGHVNRYVRRLEFADGRSSSVAGSEVRAGDKIVGTITSAAPNAPWALATIRREVDPGATVTVDNRPATVHPRH
jgi:folate-binding protein YgfZ